MFTQIKKISAQLVIIGGGIGGLGLAAEALKRGVKVLVLDKGLNNTTSAATGIFDARPDHLLKDAESVQATASEVTKWRELLWLYPDLIKPAVFHLLLDNFAPYEAAWFKSLLDYYDEAARQRSWGLPEKSIEISIKELEQSEPNLRKKHFRRAFRFWLWTVNANELIRSLIEQSRITNGDNFSIEYISEIVDYELRSRIINEVVVKTKNNEIIKISNNLRPIIVVNSTGPWLNEPLIQMGIKIPIDLYLGIQAKISGYYFKSGLIFFGENKKYLISQQMSDYVQVGPTNTNFGSSPRVISEPEAQCALKFLGKSFNNIIDSSANPANPVLLKYGWRVRPKGLLETDRPIIWRHDDGGIDNLYSLLPGKITLGLLTGRELLDRAVADGLLSSKNIKCLNSTKLLSLNGSRKNLSNYRLLSSRFKSLAALGSKIIPPQS